MKRILKMISLVLTVCFIMTGCSNETVETPTPIPNEPDKPVVTDENDTNIETDFNSELVVRFGREGEPFTMNLYDNDTARAISRYVGTSDWNLPIYHYDDYENYEVMQYYDIPSRYDIPSDPETITSEKAGEVFYSAPNRIVLFFHDANVTGEYTRLGYFDASDEFISAVENNPVVEGWSNKIVSISPME